MVRSVNEPIAFLLQMECAAARAINTKYKLTKEKISH